MAKIEPFEKFALRYEAWFSRHRFAYESELQAVRELLPKGGEGVEIGVGSGRFAAPLGVRLGVEPSHKMLELAKEKGVEVVGGVAEALPLPPSRFDFALMVATLCFLDDVETAFREAWKVLKPGGCLVIGFIDRESPLGRLYQQRKGEDVFYGEATFHSVEEVVSRLRKSGFENFHFTQTIFHNLPEITAVEPVEEGHGKGSFVVVRARKPR
ncbi:methyltransferase domain-containing protein [Candidatus Hecatella orcuttiae]|jgi:SAM-dependent methyltransferase|uniref:methyltransferase domain-containing protein n=1 Tax=Candidatus Hecatella orcuttiae TaxID=1935119 RepID=UPI00286806BB|nr:methyltransferase domain-containing protein [Candidatus Hecatella orcuttiae]